MRLIYRSLRANLNPHILNKFLCNVAELLNTELLPHRFFKELMKSLIILMRLKPIKV